MSEQKTLVEVQHLQQYFPAGGVGKNRKYVQAVDDVSFAIRKGETLGLVGESGCGKTTCGRTCLGMYNKTDGQVLYRGKDVHALKGSELFAYKREAQMVFQDPYASLDPRMKVRDIIAEPLETYHVCKTKAETTHRVLELMQAVGVPAEFLNRYPHQFSGGQRQRIGIARAIALQPDLIVCDEPVSALDVSVQSQVLNLLKDLQKQYGLTYLFIGHDLSVINFIADRVCVMFLGHVCEVATKEELYSRPMHPYTAGLMAAVSSLARGNGALEIIPGAVPNLLHLPAGCSFSPRCSKCGTHCGDVVPELREVSPGHLVRCINIPEVRL